MADPQGLLELVVQCSVFTLVISLWIAGVMTWAGRRAAVARKIRLRMNPSESEPQGKRELRLWRDGKAATITVKRGNKAATLMRRLDEKCRRAGWDFGAAPVLTGVIGAVLLVGIFVTIVSRSLIIGGGFGFGVLIAFNIFLGFRISKREAQFERQLVDAMELASRSLRAGHPLLAAFKLISEEMPAPVNSMFAELCQRHAMGTSIADALQDAAARSTSDDMRIFATAVAIQSRSGGNLADVIDRLATVVRERMRLNRRVRILTSQTQMSKRILVFLPFFTFFALNLLNPTYMSTLYTVEAGQMMLGVSAVMLAMGVWIINKMAVLKF